MTPVPRNVISEGSARRHSAPHMVKRKGDRGNTSAHNCNVLCATVRIPVVASSHPNVFFFRTHALAPDQKIVGTPTSLKVMCVFRCSRLCPDETVPNHSDGKSVFARPQCEPSRTPHTACNETAMHLPNRSGSGGAFLSSFITLALGEAFFEESTGIHHMQLCFIIWVGPDSISPTSCSLRVVTVLSLPCSQLWPYRR